MAKRELVWRVIVAREREVSDTAQRNSFVFELRMALRHAKRCKLVRLVETRKGMCVWWAGDAVTLRVVADASSKLG